MGGMHHLVSRGVEFAYQQAGREDIKQINIPTWAVVTLAFAVISHFILHLHVTYTYGLLVPTLTVVESPTATAIVRTTEAYTDDENPDAPLLSKEEKEAQMPVVDEEVLILANKPITSKLRSTVRHLFQKTGSKHTAWRGVGGFVIYNIVVMLVTSTLMSIFGRHSSTVLNIPAAGLTCVLSTAWIQQMIAMPGKSYFGRVKELAKARVFWKLALPVMAVEAVEASVFMLPRQLSILFGFAAVMKNDNQALSGVMVLGIAVAMVTLLFGIFFVVIPLNIGLVRYQASLLDSETETVVPIDRTLGAAEDKNIKTAWKSFSRDGCRRLAKNYVKYIMIQTSLMLLFVITIGATLYSVLGDEGIDYVRKQIDEHHKHD